MLAPRAARTLTVIKKQRSIRRPTTRTRMCTIRHAIRPSSPLPKQQGSSSTGRSSRAAHDMECIYITLAKRTGVHARTRQTLRAAATTRASQMHADNHTGPCNLTGTHTPHKRRATLPERSPGGIFPMLSARPVEARCTRTSEHSTCRAASTSEE
jgi:hypothetical protein